MKVGLQCFFTASSVPPAELAVAAEAAGFESIWAGDHSHVPLDPSGAPPLDTRTGKPAPGHYAELLDPFVALTHAASVTSTIRLGTGICLVTERDPITTAKVVASLDNLSGGRFLFGVGAGWNEIEMRDHGTDPARRRQLLKERIEAMKTIWQQETASYDGNLVYFGPMRCGPKPVQLPHPPIFIGGGPSNLDRVVAYGDGWIPSTTVDTAEAFLKHVEDLQRRAEAAGRGPLPVTGIHVVDVDEFSAGRREFTDRDWDAYEEAGLDRVVLSVPVARDAVLRQVDRYAHFAVRAS